MLRNKKMNLDEREISEFNRLYRFCYFFILLATWIYFEVAVFSIYEDRYFSITVGTICLIGSVSMLLKGLSITYRNLDVLIPTIYFTAHNLLYVLDYVLRKIFNITIDWEVDITWYLSLVASFIVVYIILEIIYKIGINKLNKEIE